ncbi:MAG: hypothetical protein ACYDAP_03105 [Thermoplasmataceae archaeon]
MTTSDAMELGRREASKRIEPSIINAILMTIKAIMERKKYEKMPSSKINGIKLINRELVLPKAMAFQLPIKEDSKMVICGSTMNVNPLKMTIEGITRN